MSSTPHPGSTFADRYVIDRPLGKGGFATVWLATDLTTGQQVALKALTMESGGYDRGTELRFDRECRLFSGLSSPFIVRLLDHGSTADGVLYLTFELLPGQDLSELIAQVGVLEPGAAIHILRQLLLALEAAHAVGVIHRDIKPENVRVFAEGNDPLRVKLIDFGIARAVDDGSPSVTATGELIGTPRYMSPEQLTARPLTPTSDLYSLGIVFFELLQGRDSLHGGRWGDQIARLRSGHVFAVPGIQQFGTGLLPILTRMTAKDPAARYPSARAVLNALDSLEGDRTEVGRTVRPDPNTVTGPTPAPSRVTWALIAGLVLAAVAGLALYAVGSAPAPELRREPGKRSWPAHPRPKPIPEPAAASEPDAGTAPEPVDEPIVVDNPDVDGCGQAPFTEGLKLPIAYPEKYRPNYRYPLVVLLHDDAEPPAMLLDRGKFQRLADESEVIVIAPSGAKVDLSALQLPEVAWASAWRGGDEEKRWTRTRVVNGVRRTAAALCVDLGRVFLVGHGHGGAVVQRLACEGWVNAIATNAHHYDTTMQCPKTPKPMLLVLPNKNGEMPPEGGTPCSKERGNLRPSFERLIQGWHARNDCEGALEISQTDGGVCTAWRCKTPFTSCIVDGGRPWWGMPDMEPCGGFAPREFDTTTAVWSFFAEQDPIPPDAYLPLVPREPKDPLED